MKIISFQLCVLPVQREAVYQARRGMRPSASSVRGRGQHRQEEEAGGRARRAQQRRVRARREGGDDQGVLRAVCERGV